MSIEHSPARQRRKPVSRLAYSIKEWCELVNISRASAYRMMADGRLRYVEIAGVRRIPAEENVRLGLSTAA
jgi:excisionase family DNA binding protein